MQQDVKILIIHSAFSHTHTLLVLRPSPSLPCLKCQVTQRGSSFWCQEKCVTVSPLALLQGPTPSSHQFICFDTNNLSNLLLVYYWQTCFCTSQMKTSQSSLWMCVCVTRDTDCVVDRRFELIRLKTEAQYRACVTDCIIEWKWLLGWKNEASAEVC